MARRTGIALGREVVRTMRKITCERDQKIRVFTLEPYEPGTVPMSALVVGDAFYVDMPGELYMDYGLALKKESTFQITNTCFTNGPYLTTPKREGAGGASLTGGTCRALKIVEDARTLLMSAARANGKPVPVIPLEKALAGLKHPEPHERAEAARALGIRRHAASRTTVEKLLKDPDGEVRIQAAFALGKIGSISSIGPLLDLVMKEPVTADVVQVSVGRLFSEDAERTLIREIESDSPAVRAVAALALGRSKRPAKVLAPLVKALTDKSAAVRRNAALSLGKLGREEAVEALTRTLLKEKNATVLINVLAALGKLQAQGAVPEIEKLLAKKNHQVSRQAALTLLAMKRPLTLDESRLTAFAACGPVDRWLADKLKKSVQNPNRP